MPIARARVCMALLQKRAEPKPRKSRAKKPKQAHWTLAAVKESDGDEHLEQLLKEIFPQELHTHVWNRKLVQMGMSQMGRQKLAEVKQDMDISDREDLISFADLIEYDEGRIQ